MSRGDLITPLSLTCVSMTPTVQTLVRHGQPATVTAEYGFRRVLGADGGDQGVEGAINRQPARRMDTLVTPVEPLDRYRQYIAQRLQGIVAHKSGSLP